MVAKKNILVFGSSGHASVVIDCIEKEGTYAIACLADSFKKAGEGIMDYDIKGTEDDLPRLIKEFSLSGIFVAIGDNWVRKNLVEKISLIAPELEFVNAIHPSASIGKNVTLGKGIVVMAGSVINSGSQISDFSILNTRCSIDHDCNIGNFSSIAPGATLGGNVVVGDFSAISLGANVMHTIHIGKHSLIGAGALVNKNVSDYAVAFGVPAVEIRKRIAGEKYL